MPTVVATPNTFDANSYTTRTRGDSYYGVRLFATAWTGASADTKDTALIMATRVMDASLTARRVFSPPVGSKAGYYTVRPTWTGMRSALNLSKLAWGRIGMVDRNGVAIDETVFPDELQDATAELAGQLIKADRTLDNNIALKGITDIKAGPVSLSFASGAAAFSQGLPQAVLDLLVPTWLTEQVVHGMYQASIEVVSE